MCNAYILSGTLIDINFVYTRTLILLFDYISLSLGSNSESLYPFRTYQCRKIFIVHVNLYYATVFLKLGISAAVLKCHCAAAGRACAHRWQPVMIELCFNFLMSLINLSVESEYTDITKDCFITFVIDSGPLHVKG